MPVSNNFTFSHKELTELLIKASDLHEGRWMLSVTFAFSIGNFGPSSEQALPGAMAAIQQIGIQRVENEDAPAGLVVDASEVNPA